MASLRSRAAPLLARGRCSWTRLFCASAEPAETGGGRAPLIFAAGALFGGSAAALAVWAMTPSELVAASPHQDQYRREVFVMRGPSGSGKSTLARDLLHRRLAESGVSGVDGQAWLSRAFMFSTDDFFAGLDAETGREVYSFDFKALKRNHEQNQARCALAMELGVSPLVIDNTNTQLWEMRPYVELAQQHGYRVEIVDALQFQEVDLATLKQRCSARSESATGKDIPEAAIERQFNGFQKLPADPAAAQAAIMVAEPPWKKKAAAEAKL